MSNVNGYIFCPYCGCQVPQGTTQCPNCNAILAAPAPAATPAPAAAPNRGYAAPNQGYAAPNQGYAAPNQGYAASNQGYAAPNQGYAAPNQGYAAPNQGYAAPNQGYPVPPQQPVPANYGYRGPAPAPSRPVLQLRTNRALWKYILLSIVTLGIYGIVVDCHMVRDLNTLASPYDGKRTMHPIPAYLLGCVTLGIYTLIWEHKYANRIGSELQRRGIPYSFSAKHFWLWNFLGSVIVVGPFIFKHKQMFATNKLCADYNAKG